jgi:SAM-dependent methyltransferase
MSRIERTSPLLELKEFYNKKMTTTGPSFSLRMEQTLQVARGFAISSLLDIGSGDGEFTAAFAKSCKSTTVVGVDISRTMVRTSTKHFDTVVGTFFPRLPFRNESFEGVLCSEVIEHTIDPDNLILEVYRVLKPGGLLFLTTPNMASWFNRLGLLFGYQPHFTEVSLHHNVGKFYLGSASENSHDAIGGHLRLFTSTALDSLLEIYGFDAFTKKGAGVGFNGRSSLPYPLGLLDRFLSRKHSLSAFLIYVCRKKAYSRPLVREDSRTMEIS